MRLWRRNSEFSTKPWLLEQRSSKNFIIFVVFCMTFTDMFLYGLIVPVIPHALQKRVGVPREGAQAYTSLLLALYGAAILIFSPVFGWLADQMGSRKSALLFGLVLLVSATSLLCIGTSVPLLACGRFLQGVSCAMVWTVGLALLADTVPYEELGKSMGIVSLSMTSGTVLGPLGGGIVYDSSGYYAVFGMAFGLIALDVLLRTVMIEKKIAAKYSERPQIRNYGTVSDESSETGSLASGRRSNVANSRNGSLYASRNDHTGLHLPPVIWLLRSPRLVVGMWSAMMYGVMLTAFDAVIPLFVMEVFNWSSSGAGVAFLTIFLPSCLSPVVGHLTDRFGPRGFAASGFLLAAPFYVALRFVTHNTVEQAVLLCTLLFMIGLSITFISTPVFTEIIHIIYDEEAKQPDIFGAGGAAAQAYGLFNFAYAAGSIIGPIYAGFVKDHAGWSTMSWSLGLSCGVSSIPVFLITGGWIGNSLKSRSNKDKTQWWPGQFG